MKKNRITVYADVVSSEKNLGFKGFELIKAIVMISLIFHY